MANSKKVKKAYHKELSKAEATAEKAAKATTTIKSSHFEIKHKSCDYCNKKYKHDGANCKNSCCKCNSGFGSCSSSSQSLSFFHSSPYSPNSVITFTTTIIYAGMQKIYNLFWRLSPHCQPNHKKKQQHNINNVTFKNFTSVPLTPSPTASSPNSSNIVTSLRWNFLLWLFLSLLEPCISLTMTEVRIPKHIMRHETAVLGCKYDLDGESLYSVKWYKDGFEFYRYVPRDMPPGQVFPLPGVDVELQNSTDNVVVLNRVTLQSTGRYRCEVSGEAPSFQTVSGHEDMIVVVTPLKGPQISGGQPRYSIGEKVSVNCTSAASKPICHLSWLINGVHANRSYLRYYEPKIVGREGLEVATLGLEFRVRG